MTEYQTVEYKQVWKDEYLKWLCGFANADDGKAVCVVSCGQVAGEGE